MRAAWWHRSPVFTARWPYVRASSYRLRECSTRDIVLSAQPARRLQAQAPAMRTKGRLQVGADADITIFDPATVKDRATLQHPNRYSEGIDWVIVMGTIVKSPKGFYRGRNPGMPVKGEYSNL